jgi:hypothetical protein
VLLLFPDGLRRGRWRLADWVSLALMGTGLVLFVVVSVPPEIEASLSALAPGADLDPTSIEAVRLIRRKGMPRRSAHGERDLRRGTYAPPWGRAAR